ncbi:DUF2817 domain-containing protein [Thalassoglobus sp.]|uniref:DUF2817 domain-containing protein n=1 Tax=Thalassoglobus sp. TaxID=2795869 RepID=UPI003AA85F8C
MGVSISIRGSNALTIQSQFSADYITARERFCETAKERGWSLSSHPREGGRDEELWTDVARIGAESPDRRLIISSGLHGVEGYFGSAIQLQALQNLQAKKFAQSGLEIVLVHALNPFGFARSRRMDQSNIDLNRNFLITGELYEGSHEFYRKLDPFLNPKSWPKRELPAQLQAIAKAMRYGLGNLKQAIAEGQYDFPLGLFYGGSEPAETMRFFESQILPEFQSAEAVLHLDLHSGLGKRGAFEYLLDYELAAKERNWLNKSLGANLPAQQLGSAYNARGSLSHWIRHQHPAAISLCWEFGTSHSISVLAALRAENAAYHWGDRGSKTFQAAKQKLREAFCPSGESWRKTVLNSADAVLQRIVKTWGNA